VPDGHRLFRVLGQGDGALALGHRHVVGVDHATHALAHDPQVVQLGVDEDFGVEGSRVLRRESLGDDQLGMGLDHVVLLQERLLGQLPVDREPEGLPPLRSHGLDLPGVEDAGEGLDALAQRRSVGVQVDPRTAAPELTPDRHQVDVAGDQVVIGEGLGLRDKRVLAVEAVAPAVEGAGEAALQRPPAFDDLDPSVPARVLVGRHLGLGGAHHNDRAVQDLVLDEVTDARNLLEPTRHLPDPGPELFGLQGVEVGVVVALLGDPVGDLDGERDVHGCNRSSSNGTPNVRSAMARTS